MRKLVYLLPIYLFLSLAPQAMAMNNVAYRTRACERCYLNKTPCNKEKPCKRCVKASVACEPRTSSGLHRKDAKPALIELRAAINQKPVTPKKSIAPEPIQDCYESDSSMVVDSDISVSEHSVTDPSSSETSIPESCTSNVSCDDSAMLELDAYYPEEAHYTYFSGEFLYSTGPAYYYDPNLENIYILPGFDDDNQ